MSIVAANALRAATRRLTAPHAEKADGSRHPFRPAEKALVSLEAFLSVCGLGGGLFMATHPLTTMPLHYLEGTWFRTWQWPGLALFFFVGVCPAIVALATLRRMPVAVVGHLCVGVGMVAWILLEAAWVVVSPPLQVAMGLVGLAVLALGVHEFVGRICAT